MAHQCLQCGQSFPDGSAQLLKGCSCGGTRFFYTQAPLAKQEREALQKQANQDIKAILEELVKGHGGPARPAYEDPLWSKEARDKWVQVDAGKLRAHASDAFQEVATPSEAPTVSARIAATLPRSAPPPALQQAPVPMLKPQPKAAPRAAAKHHAEQATLPFESEPAPLTSRTAAIDAAAPTEAKPEVVVVNEPGKYEIDVKQLLEKSPVVVRRDGVYVVHLPSVFGSPGPKK